MAHPEVDVARITGSSDANAHTPDVREGQVSPDFHNAVLEVEHPTTASQTGGTQSHNPEAHA